MKGYYFSTTDRKLRYRDNRPISVGLTHSVEGELVLCKRGLHFSVKLIDALYYAPGPILWRVESGEEVLVGKDKCVARERTYLAEFDATDVLYAFSRRVALDVHHLAAPYYKDQEEADMVKKYLETGEEGLGEGVRNATVGLGPAADAANAAGYAARYAAYAADAAGAARYAAAGGGNKYTQWLEEMVIEATGWEETS